MCVALTPMIDHHISARLQAAVSQPRPCSRLPDGSSAVWGMHAAAPHPDRDRSGLGRLGRHAEMRDAAERTSPQPPCLYTRRTSQLKSGSCTLGVLILG